MHTDCSCPSGCVKDTICTTACEMKIAAVRSHERFGCPVCGAEELLTKDVLNIRAYKVHDSAGWWSQCLREHTIFHDGKQHVIPASTERGDNRGLWFVFDEKANRWKVDLEDGPVIAWWEKED